MENLATGFPVFEMSSNILGKKCLVRMTKLLVSSQCAKPIAVVRSREQSWFFVCLVTEFNKCAETMSCSSQKW